MSYVKYPAFSAGNVKTLTLLDRVVMGVNVLLRISPNIAVVPRATRPPEHLRGGRPPSPRFLARFCVLPPGGAALGVLDTLVIDYRLHELHVRTLNTAGFP